MSLHLKAFLLSLFLSGIFSMGGTGGAAALVPLLNMIGVSFSISKATALFVSVTATATSSFMNIKRKILDFKFTVPLLFTMSVFLPLGAYLSQYLNITTMKWMLSIFLIISSLLIFFRKDSNLKIRNNFILLFTGALVGLFSGIVGISGGNILIALLVLFGFDPKKIAISVSFIIPFSSMAGFIIYANTFQIDWFLVFICALAAIIGGFIGNRIMHYKLNSEHIKKLIGIFLFLIGIKLIFSLL